MDDSPRSSKRRKLDTATATPTRKTSTPLVKSTLRKASARLASQTTTTSTPSEQPDEEAATTPSRSSRATRGTVSTPTAALNGIIRKRAQVDEKDVYDDIEGALPLQEGESPAPSSASAPRGKKGSTAKRVRHKMMHLDPSKPHPFKKDQSAAPVRPTANGTVNGDSPSQSAFRSLVNGYRHGTDVEAEIQDELAAAEPTPSKRMKTPNRGSLVTKGSAELHSARVRKPSARATRRGAEAVEEDDEEDPLDTVVVDAPTPTKTRSSKRRAPIPDSEDELGDRGRPSRTASARQRRRSNRADHYENREESVGQSEEEQAEAGAESNGDDEDDMDMDGGSVLASVLDPTEPSPFNKPTPTRHTKERNLVLDGNLVAGRELELLKTVVMERITGKRPAPLVGLDEEYKTVHQLVEHTITAGEGNSMLLIGARGSGKTALVNKVLTEVSKDNGDDYHVVRLNGFIHTDDKIALREIWRQLGKEMDIEEDGGLGKNYADTLTTLLALLSHPSEHTGEMTEQVARAVIFVMDEFDLFAQHPRQTLLYNLFDIAQSRKAPIAVLGLTTRIDVANSLEKRVKSRFSHRYVHLSLAKTFTAFQEFCKASLLFQPDQLSVEERSILSSAPSTTPSKKSKKAAKNNLLTEWNSNINSLFASKTFLTSQLAPAFYLTKSIPSILTTFLLPTANLSPSHPFISPSTLLSPPDSKLALIPHLSTLALSLLIAAARLDIIHDSDTCNFNMCYDEYVTLASKARIQSAAGGATSSGSVSKVWGKEVARREWEGLVDLALVLPVAGGGVGGSGGGMDGKGGFAMVRCDVALEEIGVVLGREKGGEKGLERWCRQL